MELSPASPQPRLSPSLPAPLSRVFIFRGEPRPDSGQLDYAWKHHQSNCAKAFIHNFGDCDVCPKDSVLNIDFKNVCPRASLLYHIEYFRCPKSPLFDYLLIHQAIQLSSFPSKSLLRPCHL